MVTIYKLYCIHTQQAYVGCTSGKMGKRMREHRCLLKGNKHSSKFLQFLWNEFGPSGFRLESLETLPKDASVIDKRKREIFWMEHFEKLGLFLNNNKQSFQFPIGAPAKAVAARVARGYRPSAESNKKRSLAQIGIPHNYGWKISAAKKGVSPRTAKCEGCGRQISISNMSRHVGPCSEKVVMR